MSSSSGAELIVDHLGGEKFLNSLGARDFAVDDRHFSFTLVHDNPKGVHSVTISIEPNGSFKVVCYGRMVSGSFHAPVVARENVAIAESLAAVLGKLAGLDTLRHRHL